MYQRLIIIALALFISVTLHAKNYAVIALDDIFTIFPVDDVPPIDPQMRQAFLDAINQADRINKTVGMKVSSVHPIPLHGTTNFTVPHICTLMI